MWMLDVSRFEAAPPVRDPHDHVGVPGLLRRAEVAALADFAEIRAPGLGPVSALECRGACAPPIAGIRKSLIVNDLDASWRSRHEPSFPGRRVAGRRNAA